jgi:hypothetical protein
MTWTTFFEESRRQSTLGTHSWTALSTVYIVTGSPHPWDQTLSSPPGSGILSPIKVCGTTSSKYGDRWVGLISNMENESSDKGRCYLWRAT